MDKRLLPCKMNIMLEEDPLKSRILVRRLAVCTEAQAALALFLRVATRQRLKARRFDRRPFAERGRRAYTSTRAPLRQPCRRQGCPDWAVEERHRVANSEPRKP